MTVGLGKDCNGLDAHFLSSTHHAQCDLTSVGDEDLLEQLYFEKAGVQRFLSDNAWDVHLQGRKSLKIVMCEHIYTKRWMRYVDPGYE